MAGPVLPFHRVRAAGLKAAKVLSDLNTQERACERGSKFSYLSFEVRAENKHGAQVHLV